MKEAEMEEIADLINLTLNKEAGEPVLDSVRKRVDVLVKKFPLYEMPLL